ncbi:MAG: helix-turn-helix transcriptional regulator [Actinomycetota bacterium]|nr:helix-turn-helix transcriptional regulator [Actinomycetota bacterium]
MPRPNPTRVISQEPNLARRIAYERQQRGWSYEGTASRLTAAGCPIAGSAIFKIEKGDPPRRISVDELVAFAKIFDAPLEELLTPLEFLFEVEAAELLVRITRAQKGLTDAASELLTAVQEASRLQESSRKRLFQSYADMGRVVFDVIPMPGVPDEVQKAFERLARAILQPLNG